MLDELEALQDAPWLIVSSRLADERLWAEVLNRGGYDLLATPFDADEVRHVLAYAIESWNRRRSTPALRPVDPATAPESNSLEGRAAALNFTPFSTST